MSFLLHRIRERDDNDVRAGTGGREVLNLGIQELDQLPDALLLVIDPKNRIDLPRVQRAIPAVVHLKVARERRVAIEANKIAIKDLL